MGLKIFYTQFTQIKPPIPWLLQPHFVASVRRKFTLPKVGIGSPPGLPQLQSSIIEGKTPRLEVFFTLLERSWSVDLQPKLWTKEGPEVKLAIWLPTTKSQESTWFRRLQEECDMALESSQRELQNWFRPHPIRRSEQEVMDAQSPGTPTRDSFETPPWESWEKVPFGCSLRGELQRILYGGRWWLPMSPGRGESSESKVARGLSQHQKGAEWILTNLWLVLDAGLCNKKLFLFLV